MAYDGIVIRAGLANVLSGLRLVESERRMLALVNGAIGVARGGVPLPEVARLAALRVCARGCQ